MVPPILRIHSKQSPQPTASAVGYKSARSHCNENLLRTRPDVIADIHTAYLEAGADIIETNSFNGTRIALAEFGLQDHVHELNVTAARLAREAADNYGKGPRWVAGSMGALDPCNCYM